MKVILILFSIMMMKTAIAQNEKPQAKVEKIKIPYKNKTVIARRLTVSSKVQIPIETAWSYVKTPRLLQFVAKGMITFEPVGDSLPAAWQQGETYAVKMRLWGFLPFGGKHYLLIEKIDDENFEIATKEWDSAAKVWNHRVVMKTLENGYIHYEDEIIIYGGWMTGIITAFARKFYKHRKKRWQLVVRADNF